MQIYDYYEQKNKFIDIYEGKNVRIFLGDGYQSGSGVNFNSFVIDVRLRAISNYLTYKGCRVTINNIESGQVIKPVNGVLDVVYTCSVIDSNRRGDEYVLKNGRASTAGSHTINSSSFKGYGVDLATWVVLLYRYRCKIDIDDKMFQDSINVLRNFYLNIDSELFETNPHRPQLKASDVEAGKLLRDFERFMDDDFNTPKVLSVLVSYTNSLPKLSAAGNQSSYLNLQKTIVYIGRTLGLFKATNLAEITDNLLKLQQDLLSCPRYIMTKDIDRYVKERDDARVKKEYDKADHICNILKLHGVYIDDSRSKSRYTLKAR